MDDLQRQIAELTILVLKAKRERYTPSSLALAACLQIKDGESESAKDVSTLDHGLSPAEEGRRNSSC